MNNFRLSSRPSSRGGTASPPPLILWDRGGYIGEKYIITTSEIKMLLTADPIIIPLSDGRLLNLITQKLDSSIIGGSVFEIVTRDSGLFILANSLKVCASILGISRYVL